MSHRQDRSFPHSIDVFEPSNLQRCKWQHDAEEKIARKKKLKKIFLYVFCICFLSSSIFSIWFFRQEILKNQLVTEAVLAVREILPDRYHSQFDTFIPLPAKKHSTVSKSTLTTRTSSTHIVKARKLTTEETFLATVSQFFGIFYLPNTLSSSSKITALLIDSAHVLTVGTTFPKFSIGEVSFEGTVSQAKLVFSSKHPTYQIFKLAKPTVFLPFTLPPTTLYPGQSVNVISKSLSGTMQHFKASILAVSSSLKPATFKIHALKHPLSVGNAIFTDHGQLLGIISAVNTSKHIATVLAAASIKISRI